MKHALFTFVICVGSLFAQNNIVTIKILAVVNGNVITNFDINSFTSYRKMQIQKQYSSKGFISPSEKLALQKMFVQMDQTAFEELINKELIYAKFLSDGYNLPDSIIDERL